VAAVALVGLGVLALWWPVQRGGVKVGLAVAVALAAVGGYGLVALGLLDPELERCREVWPATWQLIEHHWHGVGPSQFEFFYPRYMTETAGPQRTNPSNAVLGLWSEDGMFGMLLFVGVLVLFFFAVLRWWHQTEAEPEEMATQEETSSQAIQVHKPAVHITPTPQGTITAEPPSAAAIEQKPEPSLRWEYYLGGMIAMILVFLLRANNLSPDELVSEALSAGVRAVVWFAAMPLFERIAWSPREAVASLSAGVVTLLLTLMVNPGIGYPSVVGMLLVAVALVLAIVKPEPLGWLSRQRVAFLLPLPVLAAGAFGYFAFVLYPASASASADHRTRLLEAQFFIEMDKAPQERKLRKPIDFIRQSIIEPLIQADREDPGNVRLRVLLARWYGQLWREAPLDPRSDAAKKSLAWAALAREANKEGFAGYEVEFDVRTQVARRFLGEGEKLEKMAKDSKVNLEKAAKDKKINRRQENQKIQQSLRTAAQLRLKAREHFVPAAEILQEYLPRNPTDPVLHYHIADALKSASKIEASREEARAAQRLDNKVKPPRNLTLRQREQVDSWLKADSAR
jgi:hypothetical protein